jgi:FMN phosphatase YigB (HAD superfamily)
MSDSNMPQKPLQRVLIGFDVDNTLMDPTGEAYRRTVEDFLARSELGLDPVASFRTFEEVRSHGRVLERLGLGNPIHDRGHPHGMALLCLTHCDNPAILRELDIHTEDRPAYDIVIRKLRELHHASRHGPFEKRLEAEINLRAALENRAEVERLRSEIDRIARSPIVTGLAEGYRAAERDRPAGDRTPIMAALISKGATPVVISEGRAKIQIEKLNRLGLSELFNQRVLITEAATSLPGIHRLEDAISNLMDVRVARESQAGDDELRFLWYYRCLIDAWATKTPWFYARCLHALQLDRENPEAALSKPVFVPADHWRANPLHFVMVGDRYDKDVKPLMDLLGPDVAMKLQLRMGKYENLHPESELPPDRRPDRTFTNWDSLAKFLTDELRLEDVKPITTPPDIVPRNEVHTDYVERGLDSPYEAVRLVATAVAEMTR